MDPNDDTPGGRRVVRTELVLDSVKRTLAAELETWTRRHGGSGHPDCTDTGAAADVRRPAGVRPQPSIGGRSLFAGAMANVAQDRRTEEQPAESTPKELPRRPYRP